MIKSAAMIRRSLTLIAIAVRFLAACPLVMPAWAPEAALASQANWVIPGPPLPMTTLATDLNAALQAIGTCSSGPSAPTIGPANAPIPLMCWWNTVTTPWVLNYYDGAQWVSTGFALNSSTHAFSAALGSNLLALTFGAHLTSGGSSYNGSAGVTITSDATNANTASTIVARDASNNFSAGTITASLTGHASLDLALTGGTLTGALTVSGASLGLSGNQSLAAWTTNGARYANIAGTLTDTTSSGTVAAVYDSVFGGNTIAASNVTTYTLAVGSYFNAPVAGTNATFTSVYALGADSLDIVGGTLAAGAQALSIAATQPTSPVGTQNALLIQVTSAGSASQTTRGLRFDYLAGYTGSGVTAVISAANAVAGTGSLLIPATESITYIGNVGVTASGTASTTGMNVGDAGHATGGLRNVGGLFLAQVSINGGSNFGVVGTAYNAGTGTIAAVGVYATLAQQTAPTNIQTALLADNGAGTGNIFLGRVNGTTTFTIDNAGDVQIAPAAALAAGAHALTITATQPASPVTTQSAILETITSAGSAAQSNFGEQIVYAAGYTGVAATSAIALTNSAAGTAGAMSSTNFSGNTANSGNTNPTTTGWNAGIFGRASNGVANFGVAGIAGTNKNSGANIGVMGLALNGGSSPTEIGGWFTLGQTTVPTTTKAGIVVDTAGETAASIALFQVGAVTVASVNATGGITATLSQTSAAQSGTVCYNSGTLLVTYDATLGCLTSLEETKDIHGPIIGALAKVIDMKPFWFSPINRPPGSDLAEQPGFGAHQIEAVDKRLVGYSEDGKLMGVRYMEMTAVLAAAIKELKADNDNLRAELHRRAAGDR